jgi:imidazole glycerol-phosphate synthase subunit HisH
MKVVIIKYNAGNIQSVLFALARLDVKAAVSNDPETISGADKIIFPGVGEASSAMQFLKERDLDKVIAEARQPLLGICLGMQLLCDYSQEGSTECIGIFKQKVNKFDNTECKVPHVGWNHIKNLKSPLFKDIKDDEWMYFVHSYYVGVNEYTIATTSYCADYSAALQKDNFYAVQFHPEKSAESGQKIIENFLAL